ncbi:MAG: tetratricopeptide repeat protein, partial [Gammaproteobacteria bacterium]|nr:tetratricopeptide repeat protein [Gammaproteobacteria bacterium]
MTLIALNPSKLKYSAITSVSLLLILLLSCLAAPPALAEVSKTEVIHDLRYGEALYYFYQEKYFSAITRLMRARKYQPIRQQGDMPEILLGGLYQSYGLSDESQRIFTQLLKKNINNKTRDQAWYYLGKSYYQQGEYNQASDALNRITDTLPPTRNEERLNLLANIYLHQGKPEQAVAVLQDLDSNSIWKHYAQFNLGVALIKSGQTEKGQDLLEDSGDIKVDNNELAALKDRANLALGFSYIQQQKTKEAIEYLKKIRLVGPFSNKALLGLGWAYNLAGDHRHALSAWRELAKRNPIDPAVQEALLAIPYSTNTVGAPGRALTEYEQAIKIYAREQARLESVINAVKKGEIERVLRAKSHDLEIITPLEIKKATLTQSLPYLSQLLASYKFQAAYKNYRDLFYLRQVLADWQQQLPALQTMLRERKQAWQKKLNRISTDPRLHQLKQHSRLEKQLNAEFQHISQKQDALALASETEQQQLTQLHSIKEKIGQLRAEEIPAIKLQEQQQKYKLYYGLLYWKISTDYA